MQRLVYWLVYPLLWIISKLPFPIFYLVSDFIFLLVFYVFRYRRKTVQDNLRLVFPEKSHHELKRIEKKFFSHMVDMFLEMIKSISISDKELKKRFRLTNVKELRKIEGEGKSILLACGHYASYEWMTALQLYGINYKGFGVYKKVKNPYFDRLARRIRGRYNGELIPTYRATKTITENEKNKVKGIYAMIADQSPKLNRAKAWTDFMGIRVPIFLGTESLSRSLDMAVVFLQIEKVGRGYYEATFKTISITPKEEEDFYITRTYTKLLEKQIREKPEYYLWTHKRWKHRDAPIPKDALIF